MIKKITNTDSVKNPNFGSTWCVSGTTPRGEDGWSCRDYPWYYLDPAKIKVINGHVLTPTPTEATSHTAAQTWPQVNSAALNLYKDNRNKYLHFSQMGNDTWVDY